MTCSVEALVSAAPQTHVLPEVECGRLGCRCNAPTEIIDLHLHGFRSWLEVDRDRSVTYGEVVIFSHRPGLLIRVVVTVGLVPFSAFATTFPPFSFCVRLVLFASFRWRGRVVVASAFRSDELLDLAS